MGLTKIQLINLDKNFNKFQFVLYYDNDVIILNYNCVYNLGYFGIPISDATDSIFYNDDIFCFLGISDVEKFISIIVGYPVDPGIWPSVRTKKDFIKVLRVLECCLEF